MGMEMAVLEVMLMSEPPPVEAMALPMCFMK